MEALLEEAARFGFLYLRRRQGLTLADRAGWLSTGSARILRRIGFRYNVLRQVPQRGLVVSNHLSHLDILFYAAACRCVFVAKNEVRDWPFLGWFARWGGTIFVRRERPADAVRAGLEVERAFAAGVPVMLFPEGTSTDGAQLLPFHPLLFQPAIRAGARITPSAIGYSAADASERELCYYGDVAFASHLLSCLGFRGVRAHILSGEAVAYGSRKESAAGTQAVVEALRTHLRAALSAAHVDAVDRA